MATDAFVQPAEQPQTAALPAAKPAAQPAVENVPAGNVQYVLICKKNIFKH